MGRTSTPSRAQAAQSAANEADRLRRRAAARRLLVVVAGAAVFTTTRVPEHLQLALAAVIVVAVAWPSSAGRWSAGAAGERATAVALHGVEAEGYTALHDVRLPGRRWNLDHLLVGPAGVVVVETKQWATPVRVARRRRPSVLRPMAWQVDAVSAALGHHLPVAQFLCIHGARVHRRWWARGAPVGDGAHLRRWLRAQPDLLGRSDVIEAMRLVRTRFEYAGSGERLSHGRTKRTDRALVERPPQR